VNPAVYVVVTLDPRTGSITDLEILDVPPAWNLAELGQVCYVGNVNGGDSVQWYQRPA
jgi:hypothetical protein